MTILRLNIIALHYGVFLLFCPPVYIVTTQQSVEKVLHYYDTWILHT